MAYSIVVMGASMGGLAAIETVLGGLPAGFPLPVTIVQHRGPDSSGEALVKILRRHTPLRLSEPDDKEPIVPGTVYIAPPDYHLLIERGEFSLSTEAPVAFARPSIDVLFETAAQAYGNEVIAVVMTGASADGARGAAGIRAAGGCVIVQDPATAESPQMPRSALPYASPDAVLPVDGIAPLLLRLTHPEVPATRLQEGRASS